MNTLSEVEGMPTFRIIKNKKTFSVFIYLESTDGLRHSFYLPIGPFWDQIESGEMKHPMSFSDAVDIPLRYLDAVRNMLLTLGKIDS